MQEREDTFGKEKLQNSRGQEADDAMAKMKRRLDGK